ncbi:MAG: NYN domain-containing protein [Candidatus Hydrogenedentes bacterium]|nr:NYN domain-containing protein [Candidatus Hydrogenedentota bacterium]
MAISCRVPCVEIFLDHSNFYNGLRQQFGDGRVGFVKLVNRITGQRSLVQFNIYTGTVDARREPNKASAQQSFFTAIRHLPFPVRHFTRPLKYYASWPQVPPQEKGVDARIVQDLIMRAVDGTYHVAVLLSRDQDFCEVVELLHVRFPVELDTYYPVARRHLFEASRSCFAHAEVITKKFYCEIR